MPSVGPELPSHLNKRKRSADGLDDTDSPPRKLQAASPPRTVGPALPPTSKNPDELDIESDSEDDYGPSIPSAKAPSPPAKRAVGPTLPPTTNPDEVNLDSDSEDDTYGPSIPKPAVPKRVLGPAPPPANISERPSHPADSASDDDSDDDDYGPSLPPAPGSEAESTYLAQRAAEEETARSAASSAPVKPQRAEWMLAPPSDSDWSTRVDPTKLKNRKFASGKGAKAPAEKNGISAIWTETPEEKRRRLEDEVLGRAEKAVNAGGGRKGIGEMSGRGDREEVETERRIREYNKKNRGKSLMEERRAAQDRGALEKEEEDDPSKRGFDREKDMALGGRMGEVKKREMLGRAADFGSRFQKGKYL